MQVQSDKRANLFHDGPPMTSRHPRQPYSQQATGRCKGHVIWPSTSGGTVSISAAQLAYMLDGIDWRNPVHTFRPERAG